MSDPITLDSLVVAAGDQVSSPLAEEVAILQLSAGEYYSLDPVAARIWSLLESPVSARRIRDLLVAEYEVDAERCERDVLAFLGELREARLIEVRDSPDP